MRIPLYIDFSDKNVIIIGGGSVGTTRAKKFVRAGANVTVYSEKFTEDLLNLSREGKIKLVKTDVRNLNLEEVIKGAHLIVVAIGDKNYNDKILNLAKNYKTLVNLANDADRTEVVVPFEGGRDGIRFAVTTEGKSGIVAREVRDRFQHILENDIETIHFLKAMDYVKRYMKSKDIPVNLRLQLYSIIGSDEEFRRLAMKGKIDEAIKRAEVIIEDYKNLRGEVEF